MGNEALDIKRSKREVAKKNGESKKSEQIGGIYPQHPMLQVIPSRVPQNTLNNQISTDDKKYLNPKPPPRNTKIGNGDNTQRVQVIHEHHDHRRSPQCFNRVIF